MFLTPEGKKRNPYSFSPFLGGKRICIGKTFVETVSKIVLPTLWSNFNFAFTPNIDPKSYEMPANNLTCLREPDITLVISKKD
jgi:cytochrome P450